MTEIYTHRYHGDIPKRVRARISANVESVVEQHGDNPDQREDMIEDLIDIAYDAFHVGWQSGFIDDTQPEPAERHESIMEALEKLKKTIDEARPDPNIVDRLNDSKAHIDVGIMEMTKDLANFNYGGTK